MGSSAGLLLVICYSSVVTHVTKIVQIYNIYFIYASARELFLRKSAFLSKKYKIINHQLSIIN